MAPAAYADLITASGAGALPGTAEDLTGMSPSEITGSIPDTTDPLLGVNMFAIDIVDFQSFSAITIGRPSALPIRICSCSTRLVAVSRQTTILMVAIRFLVCRPR
jgi:hypothetical protein